jgi:renalase
MGTRAPGGRACSRVLTDGAIKELSFDHGVQFLAPRSGSDFEKEVKEWVKAGVVAPWQGRFGSLDSKTSKFTPFTPDSTRINSDSSRTTSTNSFCGLGNSTNSTTSSTVYVGVPSQGAIAQHLASTIKTPTMVKGSSGSDSKEADASLSPPAAAAAAAPAPTPAKPTVFNVHPNDSIVKTGHKVTGLFYNKSQKLWTVEGVPRSASATTPASFGAFNAIIVADALVVLPDSAGYATGLVEGEDVDIEVQNIVEKIQKVKHQPVFSLLVAFDSDSKEKKVNADGDGLLDVSIEESSVPFDGATVVSTDGESGSAGSFQWIARNSSKPGRKTGTPKKEESTGSGDGDGVGSTWVAITTPERAYKLLKTWPLHTTKGLYNPQTHEYRDAVAKELLGEFIETIGKAAAAAVAGTEKEKEEENRDGQSKIDLRSRVVYCHAQRWGRGFVENPLEVDYLGSEAALFAACGDFCGGVASVSPVEAAWQSGQKAADAVACWLGNSSSNVE